MNTKPPTRSFPCALGFLALLLSMTCADAALVQGSTTLLDTPFTTYQEPGQSAYRIICQTPCPIPVATLQAASDGFSAARLQLIALAGIDTLESLRPVDVSYETNAVCTSPGAASGYSSLYLPGDPAPPNQPRVRLCLFLWDKQQSGYIDYFNADEAHLPSSQLLAMHEYAHSVFFNRNQASLEDFAYYWSFVVSGLFDLPDGMCSAVLESYGVAPLLVRMCRDYGLTDADVRAALQSMAAVHQSGLGYHATRTSIAQMREAFDTRLGLDTSPAFLSVGFSPQQVGRRLAGTLTGLGQGTVYRFNTGFPDREFWIEGLALYDLAHIKLEYPTCLANAPFLDWQLAFDVVADAHREYDNILPDPTFSDTTKITYSFAHWTPPAGVVAQNLRVYRLNNHCGAGAPSWSEIPASQVNFDHNAKRVTFTTNRGGTFALMQADEIFANGFQ
jgi:hypothetical protein